MTTYPWAAGYIDSARPKIVTSRFQYEDSFTLERSLATGGYEGLKAALIQSGRANPTDNDILNLYRKLHTRGTN